MWEQMIRKYSSGMKRFLSIVFVFAMVSLKAQTLDEKYPFLKLDKNRLDFYGDSTAFVQTFDKLDKIILEGQGQFNLLHMGGSHVQGGVLSHSMRKHVQSLAPGLKGQRGLLFPFKLAKTNNPWNYIVEMKGKWEGNRISVKDHQSHWGISGVTATTQDEGAVAEIFAREPQDGLTFTKARIF